MNNVVVRKFQSIQSPNFTETNNLVDIVLPRGGVNLDKSNVNVLIRVNTTDASASTGAGVYNYHFTYDGGVMPFDNVAMVRNCNLNSDQYGRLADVREVRVVRQHLNNYGMSLGEKRSSGYKKLRLNRELNDIVVGSGLELFREGSTKSVNNLLEIPIPVSQLFNLGNVENLPTDKMTGDTRIHLELGLDKIQIAQLQGVGTDNSDFIDASYCEYEDISNNTGSDLDVDTLTTKTAFENLCDSPFYVGQKLSFSADISGGSITPQEAVINVITHDPTTKKLTFTLNRTIHTILGTPAGLFMNNIVSDGVNAGSISYEVVGVELECEFSPSSGAVNTLQYTTWRTEETNGNSLQNYRNIFTLEPECMNMMLLLPDDGFGKELFCLNADAKYESYRFRIDGVGDLTNRNVEPDSGLYNDRVNMTFLQHGAGLQSLIRVPLTGNDYINQATADGVPNDENKLFFAGNPTPITNDNKLLQVEVNCKAGQGVKRVILAKELLRTIEL